MEGTTLRREGGRGRGGNRGNHGGFWTEQSSEHYMVLDLNARGLWGPSQGPRPQKRIFTSGSSLAWIVSMKRTWWGTVVITRVCVRRPSPKKRTPFSRAPSVTPEAAKMMLGPGARSSVR